MMTLQDSGTMAVRTVATMAVRTAAVAAAAAADPTGGTRKRLVRTALALHPPAPRASYV